MNGTANAQHDFPHRHKPYPILPVSLQRALNSLKANLVRYNLKVKSSVVDPDSYMDPLFVWIRIHPSSNKNSKKNHDFYCFWPFLTSLQLFTFEY
jgi:hypothetical protein